MRFLRFRLHQECRSGSRSLKFLAGDEEPRDHEANGEGEVILTNEVW